VVKVDKVAEVAKASHQTHQVAEEIDAYSYPNESKNYC